MEEYIDREKYCAKICNCNPKNCNKDRCPIWMMEKSDVVPVVRCKECKHYCSESCAMRYREFDVVEEGFCSYGERNVE